MVNKENIDDKDLVFINHQWTDEEKKAFSEFLKAKKSKKFVTIKQKQSHGLNRKAS